MRIFDIFRYKNTLKNKVYNIKKDIENVIAGVCNEKFSVLYYGEYKIDPKYLVFWICVNSDEMKDTLLADKILYQKLRNILVKNDYPNDAINKVHIGFESQETVDRESGGDWHVHFK